MPILYVIAVVLGLGGLWAANAANDAREEANNTERMIAATEGEIADYRAKRQFIEGLQPGPLRFTPQALSEFYSRMLEAGEVLGAGVRIESKLADMGMTQLVFEDPGDGSVGIGVCHVRMQAAMEGEDAVPVLAMFEEELAELPVTVRSVQARRVGADIALSMEVDIFGRTQ